jgi:TonB-dependent SusC/RagA subfamily outer membrane receptor
MIAFAYYLLKMFVCSGLLFLYYHLALRNKIFHQWNRFYLLTAIIISIAVPFLQFNIWSEPAGTVQDIKLLQVVYSADEYVAKATAGGTYLSLDQWISILYSLISVSVLIIFILTLIKIYSIIKSHSVMSFDDIKFVNTEEKNAPFSFLNYVFWNRQIDLNSASGEQIFQHELVHVREKHSFDKLFTQVVLIVFWCNPSFWLIRRELKMIHEFIADKKSVGQSDAHAFAAMILHAAYPQHYSHLTNQFFSSSIKRRLAMLTKNTNLKISYLSRMLALPLMAFLIVAFTIKEKNNLKAENKLENVKSFPIADTTEITLDKNTEIAKYLDEKIKLINNLNVPGNNDVQELIKEINKRTDKDSSTPRPLIVIDGKEIDNKNLNELNQLISPEKIKSIDIIKDESAISKYGKKGEHGVIEITTKKAAGAEPLTEGRIRLRDQSPLYPQAPLIVIDGKEFIDDLKKVPADQIESMTVLKGATATQLYGEKAKDGAILITTKFSNGTTIKGTIKELRVDGLKIFPSESKSPEEKKDNRIEIREGGAIDISDLNEVTVVGYGKKNEDSNKIFIKMEKEPEFPGGTVAWQSFLQRNLKASVPTDKGAPSGSYTVTVQFIVDIQGNVSSIVPLTKHGYGMEEEVVRLIKTVSKWMPGVQNGHNVNAYKKQNVTFVVSIE